MQQSLVSKEYGKAICPIRHCSLPLEACFDQNALKAHCLSCENLRTVDPLIQDFSKCSLGHCFQSEFLSDHTLCEQIFYSSIPQKEYYMQICSEWSIIYGTIQSIKNANSNFSKVFCIQQNSDWGNSNDIAQDYRQQLSNNFEYDHEKHILNDTLIEKPLINASITNFSTSESLYSRTRLRNSLNLFKDTNSMNNNSFSLKHKLKDIVSASSTTIARPPPGFERKLKQQKTIVNNSTLNAEAPNFTPKTDHTTQPKWEYSPVSHQHPFIFSNIPFEKETLSILDYSSSDSSSSPELKFQEPFPLPTKSSFSDFSVNSLLSIMSIKDAPK